MDTTDPDILFDKNGICSHCLKYETRIKENNYLKKRYPGSLERLLESIKKEGKRRQYDCIIGVSGGVDSTYTAYITKKMGLRPLAVHLDNGWDSELAVKNIENVLRKLDIDLYTHVLDWEEFKNLQLSFLKASTPDAEIPTDHAILALLYQVAAQNNVRFILSGHNIATEGGGAPAWSQGHGDWRYIKKIHAKYGDVALKTFPHYGPMTFIFYALIKRIRWIQILDYIDYNKRNVIEILKKEIGWKEYGSKHFESIYTRFYQGYILINKFGFDKKRLHLSSLIWSGQITREDALKEMGRNSYSQDLIREDKEYVIKKLGISLDEFVNIMNQPPRSFWDFPSYKRLFRRYKLLISIYHKLKRH
jgi:N-acetyl sugar amidotransferase